YRVRSSGFEGEEAAKTQADRLKEQGIDAFLVNP
ncbi:MAG: SPOR domain-containing protein, partial [Candidatus Eremiobacterota bacterium]